MDESPSALFIYSEVCYYDMSLWSALDQIVFWHWRAGQIPTSKAIFWHCWKGSSQQDIGICQHHQIVTPWRSEWSPVSGARQLLNLTVDFPAQSCTETQHHDGRLRKSQYGKERGTIGSNDRGNDRTAKSLHSEQIFSQVGGHECSQWIGCPFVLFPASTETIKQFLWGQKDKRVASWWTLRCYLSNVSVFVPLWRTIGRLSLPWG